MDTEKEVTETKRRLTALSDNDLLIELKDACDNDPELEAALVPFVRESGGALQRDAVVAVLLNYNHPEYFGLPDPAPHLSVKQ